MAKKVRIGLFINDCWQEIVGYLEPASNGYQLVTLSELLPEANIRPTKEPNFPLMPQEKSLL